MSEDQPQRKKGGRPRKHSPNSKRPSMAFRVGADLHHGLVKSAEANERSLSEEIERQLEKALRTDEMIAEAKSIARDEAISASVSYFNHLNGGPELSKFGRTMASALRYAMMVNGLSGTRYVDIQENKAAFDFVNDFVRKCVTEELLKGSAWDGADMHVVGIRSNLASAEIGDVWPKEPDDAAERAYYANQQNPDAPK